MKTKFIDRSFHIITCESKFYDNWILSKHITISFIAFRLFFLLLFSSDISVNCLVFLNSSFFLFSFICLSTSFKISLSLVLKISVSKCIWVSDCCLMPNEQFVISNIMVRWSYIRWDNDNVHFVLYQHAWLDFYSPSLQNKSQQVDMSLRHIIFLFQAYQTLCCVLSGEAANINFLVLSLTRQRLEQTIYLTQGAYTNHCTT